MDGDREKAEADELEQIALEIGGPAGTYAAARAAVVREAANTLRALSRERDEARTHLHDLRAAYMQLETKHESSIEALEPFAAYGEVLRHGREPINREILGWASETGNVSVTYGDFRRAQEIARKLKVGRARRHSSQEGEG